MKKNTMLTLTFLALLVGGVLLSGHFVNDVSASTESDISIETLAQGKTSGSDEDYAADLGITVEEWQEAKKSAFTSAVDAALQAEYITETQAETLKSGDPRFRALYQLLSDAQKEEFAKTIFLAEALGISESELESIYDTVQQAQIDQSVDKGELSQVAGDLRDALLALQQSSTFAESFTQAITDAINAEVDAGTITQTQADLLLTHLDRFTPDFGLSMHGMNDRSRFEMGGSGTDVLEDLDNSGGL